MSRKPAQRERSRYVPIIFMSAMRKDEHHMFQGYSAGAVDYVFKPVEPTIVRSKVSVFVELHRKADNEKRLLAENLRVRTEQIRTAQALGRSQAQQSLVIDALPIAFYVAGAEEGFTERRYVGGRTRPICGFQRSISSMSQGYGSTAFTKQIARMSGVASLVYWRLEIFMPSIAGDAATEAGGISSTTGRS